MTEMKIQPVVTAWAIGKCLSSPSSYESQANRYGTVSKKRTAAFALQQLAEARAKDEAQAAANLVAMQQNAAIKARVEALMAEIGMPAKVTEVDSKSRSRFPKRVTRDAGWVQDLQRECRTYDGFEQATRTYQQMKERYDLYALEAEKEGELIAAAKAQADERRRQEKLANVELAEIVLRYGLDREAEWSDVLEELRKKDQRLDLAVAMSQTRSDWSDGAYRVSDAFGRFTIQNDEDKAIANCIASILADFEDGRDFRDCAWSYSRLFAEAADQQLSTDIQKAMERSARD